MDTLAILDKIGRDLPKGTPPIPVGHPYYGKIGICIPQYGFRTKGMSLRTFESLLRDTKKFRRNPQLALQELGAITTWDSVLNARASGKADDFLGYKASQTTVAAAWSSFYRSGGLPQAGSYTNIPGGASHNVASVGAIPLINPTAPDKKYLLNLGVQHLTGIDVVLLVDLLVGCGNISANSAALQDVSSVALTRYTTGLGVMMILEVTTALGATASNVTINYTNSDNVGGRSTTQAMTASCITYRLQPVAGGAITPLQSGDIGVRSVQNIQFSAAMGAGIVALLLFKPLLLIPTLATTTYVERSTPGMLGGITELVTEAGGTLGCLTVFVLCSTTSTGTQTYFLQTCAG